MKPHPEATRRHFVQTLAAAGAAVALGSSRTLRAAEAAPAPAAAPATPAAPTITIPAVAPTPGRAKIKLGFDNYAVRAAGMKADALLDYGATLKVDSILLSDLDVYESFDEAYLKGIRKKAEDLGIQIHAGSWSICPTSRAFRNTWGTAEEHLALGIRVTKTLGSSVFRVIQGTSADRATEGGIEARIQDTVKVLKAFRSQIIDAGMKVAVENHAGDMQAWELVTLIEAAGKDYVGACIDPGNAAITMEDPLENLEILGPYVATSSMRDSMVWEYELGIRQQWMGMGEGNVDFGTYMNRFAVLAPGVPVHLELIGGQRSFPYLQKDFWKTYPKARASDLARYVALAKTGRALATPAGRGGGGRGAAAAAGAAPAGNVPAAAGGAAPAVAAGGPPAGAPGAGGRGAAGAAAPGGTARGGGGAGGVNVAQGETQKADLARSLDYCRKYLGLGVREV